MEEWAGVATTPGPATCMPAPVRSPKAAASPRMWRSNGAARHRRLYRRGGRGDRLRPAGGAGGRQCGAGGGTAGGRGGAAAGREAAARGAGRRASWRTPRPGRGPATSPRRCSTSAPPSAPHGRRPARLCPWREGCLAQRQGIQETLAGQGGEAGPAAAAWHAFPAHRCRRPGAAAAPAAARAAGRDAGGPRHALAEAPWTAAEAAEYARCRAALAPGARHRPARLHPFRAGDAAVGRHACRGSPCRRGWRRARWPRRAVRCLR